MFGAKTLAEKIVVAEFGSTAELVVEAAMHAAHMHGRGIIKHEEVLREFKRCLRRLEHLDGAGE